MPEEARPLDLPVRVGRYVLGSILGVGGFAVVVQARDELLDADVAVKILLPHHSRDPEVRERFIREARMLRRVRSSSVVTVHDVGETDGGRPYLVMDLAEGGVLQDRLDEAWSEPRDLELLVRTLADGLGALHAAGVVHRDIKPANLLVMSDRPMAPAAAGATVLREGERLVIGDLGLAKDQLASSYGPTMVGGTPGFQAPEQQEIGGRIDARTDVYAATAVLWAALTGDAPPVAEQLPVKMLDLPEKWRPVMRRGMAADPGERFGSIAEWAEAALGAVGGLGAPAGKRPTVPAAVPDAVLPYKGLAAFQPEDALLFFGRSDLVDRLVARLGQSAVLVIGGPSGSGKSSLLRAGLLPAVAGGALPGSKRWPMCLLTPTERPLASLLDALSDMPGIGALPSVERLKAEPRILATALPSQAVIAVDQLEELFTLCSQHSERQAFLDVLDQVSRGDRPGVRVLMAMRADFYGACAAYAWLAEAINRSHMLVGPMSRAQLKEAIEGPARRVGLQLEQALVEQVLIDAGDYAGALPLVSHALVETWLRREGSRLTLAGYEAAGGVAGAIGRSADEVWQDLDDVHRERARQLLPRLVHPGDGAPDTKRLMTWSEIGDDAGREVIFRFSQSRLLTVDDKGVQLAHEALLRSWRKLAVWVDESRDELRHGERLAQAAREWDRQGRLEDLLYRGTPLAAALEWRDRQPGAVGELTGSFLDASADAQVRREQAKRRRAERARRTRRRVLVGLSALTLVALVASAVAGFALFRSRRANLLASEQLARGLAASAVDLADTNPYLATVLAAEAMVRVDPPLAEARDALVRSRLALGGDHLVPYGDPIAVGDAVALAVGPLGERAATGNRDGSVDLWDLQERRRLRRLEGPQEGIHGVVFTSDGNRLVAATAAGTLWRWELDASPGRPGEVLADTDSIVWGVAAAPGSSVVAATTTSGQVWLVDAASGERTGVFDPGGGELLSVAFSPDGATLLAGSAGGEVFAWALADRSLEFSPVAAHTSDVWELEVTETAAGPRFATVSSDGTARLWDLGTGEPVPGGPFDATGDQIPLGVRGVTFAPGAEVMTLGGPEGAVYSWSIPQRKVLGTGEQPMHRDRVTGAGRSSDGEALVTLADDRTIQVWTERARPAAMTQIADLGEQPRSIAASKDGQTVAIGSAGGDAVLLGAKGETDLVLGGHSGAVSAVGFAGPSRLITGDEQGDLRIWDLRSGELIARTEGNSGAITALAVDESLSLLVTGAEDGSVALREPGSLDLITEAGTLGAPVTDVAVGGSELVVAASTRGGEVTRWTRDGRRMGDSLRVVDDTVWGVALDPSAHTLAAAGADEVLSLWSLEDAADPDLMHELGSHRSGALDVAFVDPSTVAVGSGDGLVQMWDLHSGQPVGPGLRFSSDAVRYVAASQGILWAAADTGEVVRMNALDVQAACAVAAPSFDAGQRERLLAGRAPEACG